MATTDSSHVIQCHIGLLSSRIMNTAVRISSTVGNLVIIALQLQLCCNTVNHSYYLYAGVKSIESHYSQVLELLP